MKMKKHIYILFTLFTVITAVAQQDAQYTQYMYNTVSVNPAYAGSRGVFSATALHRSQWVGIDGAPTTQSLNLHTPIKNSKVGLGFNVINDEIGNGTVQETSFDAIFSYTIPVTNKAKLSLGLKGGGNLLNIDFTKLAAFDGEGVSGQTSNIDHKFSPNIGLGAYYHTQRFYLGLSVPNLLETEHYDNASKSTATERVNLYLISGYVFNLSNSVKFKPAVLTKIVSGAPLQLDMSGNFMFSDRFILGAAYRWDAAISAMAGFQISNQFLVGLAYDKETTKLGNTAFNNGSFEVFLRFEMFKNVEKLITPRFF